MRLQSHATSAHTRSAVIYQILLVSLACRLSLVTSIDEVTDPWTLHSPVSPVPCSGLPQGVLSAPHSSGCSATRQSDPHTNPPSVVPETVGLICGRVG